MGEPVQMNVGLATVAFKEERYIQPFLKHIPDWVEDRLVLHSSTPWNGEAVGEDNTAELAKPYARVVSSYWEDEASQRNTGLDIFQDKDWVIILDPDEFLDNDNWRKLQLFLEGTNDSAVIVENQRVFWKDKEVSPCNDYQQLIAVKPHTRFIDKRIINVQYTEAPVELLHFSWRRTDKEVWSKISHYAHANDFDTKKWFEEVWLADKQTNLHPVTPEALGGLIEAIIPEEIKEILP